MSASMVADPASLSDTTLLAVERTRLAYERTLLAWVRTSTSLISFGFTIHKFFEYLRRDQPAHPDGLLDPRRAGIIMISIGVVGLVLATKNHVRDTRELRTRYAHVRQSDVTVLSILLTILGALGLAAAMTPGP